MNSPQVECSVSTCAHWMPQSLCAAGKIDVLNQSAGQMAQSIDESECKTFIGRASISNMVSSLDNVNWGGTVAEPFAAGTQLTPDVTCVIETCKYWEDGDGCSATAIRITGSHAQDCQDTNCATFVAGPH